MAIVVQKNPTVEIDGEHVKALQDVCRVAERWIEEFAHTEDDTPMRLRDFNAERVANMQGFIEFIFNEV
jgi:hypothetical protein